MDDAAQPPAGADLPWLVVGLGNPGPQYAANRHNVGAMVVDRLAADLGERLTAHRTRADVAQARLRAPGALPGPRVVLARPQTFMNVSGGPVAGLVRFFKLPLERVLVVHDELDLPLGALRLKLGGGEAGHNGLRSVSQALGSRDYCRLRLGIGRPPGRQDAADFVLRDFSPVERKELPLLLVEAADTVVDVVWSGFERAQATVNGT